MSNTESLDNKRDISYEIMRTIGCFFTIHVFSSYFYLFGKIDTSSWVFSESILGISRFSVPLFLMVSGALLLKKDMSIKMALKKLFIFFQY